MHLSVRASSIVVAVLVVCADGLSAQVRSEHPPGTALIETVPALRIQSSIEDAEREGAAFARALPPDTLRRRFVDQYPGSAERKCVRPDASVTAFRTGDFAIGADIHRLIAGLNAKIWMVPLHDPSHDRDALLVRAARLPSGPVVRLMGEPVVAAHDTVRIVNTTYGYGPGIANPGAFFPSRTFSLPGSGEWLVVATAGSDWGCAILTVR